MKQTRYVVGYKDTRTVWGKRGFRLPGQPSYKESSLSVVDVADTMTLHHAQIAAKQMPCDGAQIYELVPIKE